MRNQIAAASLLIALIASAAHAQQPIGPPVLSPFADQSHWVLMEPLEYWILDTNLVITVPRGFVTDFASIPKAFCQFLPSHGTYSRAAIVHDFLYWNQGCSRTQADRIMQIGMEESGVGESTRDTIHRAVRLGGGSAWRANQKERRAGTPRVVPETFFPIPDTITWEEFRKQLEQSGVRSKQRQNGLAPPAYCAAGDGS